MVVTDLMLNEVAGDFAADSFYLGFSTDTALEALSGATSLDGEIGSRISCTAVTVNNEVKVSGVRSSTLVIDTASGDTLTGIGLFDASTNGQLFTITTLPGILHTINFDFDVDNAFTFDRG
ncbi:MAG: hypothetical protein DRP08_04895 [Candidatus Aenigmatarchaeota archaeon]|nr:MAG: hypothetical protein DRP08_04895 [Candidatus Aenigmarchaeota archaeon]